jgi:DHA3 family multidrug efflux protein-like MFS transporter
MFTCGFLLLNITNPSAYTFVSSPILWIFVILLLGGAIAGNIYNIAVPTLVTFLVPEEKRDKANGMFGTVMGISFAITSVASGIILANGGMKMVLLISIIVTSLSLVILSFIKISERKAEHQTHDSHHPKTAETIEAKNIDIKGTIKIVRNIPGLMPLILFTTFNNLLGGVFMALMDAYGLSLVSVEQWGIIWGALSFGFIAGGLFIARKGLGKNPLKTLFIANGIIWAACIIFPIQASIVLLFIGGLFWMFLFPFIEATEQTVLQKVVPQERLGRVFGFAQSIEQSASPLTAFMIGPIAQFIFIPFMTTGAGVTLIGDWFGVGEGRGLALVFIIAGIIGVITTIVAVKSKPYKLLSKSYSK